jgi:hypothetical protein
MRLEKDRVISVCTILVTLAIIGGMLWVLIQFTALVGDWRKESQENLRQHRSMLDDHTRQFVQHSQAFEQMLRDHDATMRRLGGR